MRVLSILLNKIFVLGFIGISAQVNPNFVSVLPAELDEASGLEITSSNNLWSHNDTDFDPRIYHLDETGNLIETIDLSTVTVVDFEDVAYDGTINFYIGDFGNNLNDRTDLKIYKIPNPELLSGSVVPEVINFILSDQTNFPPAPNNMNFDIEGMFYHNDYLHLFTRNRTNPYDGLIKHYKLIAETGDQVATLQGAFFGNLSDEYSSITAADISPDGSRIVLLTEGSVFLFYDFSGDDFFGGELHYNFFDTVSPKEGITFIDACELLISEESNDGIQPGNLLSLNSCDLVPIGLDNLDSPNQMFNIIQSSDKLYIESIENANFSISIFNLNGKSLWSKEIKDYSSSIDIKDWKSGFYMLSIRSDQTLINQKFLISK